MPAKTRPTKGGTRKRLSSNGENKMTNNTTAKIRVGLARGNMKGETVCIVWYRENQSRNIKESSSSRKYTKSLKQSVEDARIVNDRFYTNISLPLQSRKQ